VVDALGRNERVQLVSVAGLHDMMLSERAAEVELTERRVTPKAVNIKTAIAFIQAHKFGGVQSTGCACEQCCWPRPSSGLGFKPNSNEKLRPRLLVGSGH
jgi:hypothetical protein